MSAELLLRGLDTNTSRLVRTFLSQFNIIHPVNREYCLIPSAIHADPMLLQDEMVGSFPCLQHFQQDRPNFTSMDIDPITCNTPTSNMTVVKKTRLIYRRMVLLAPIPSGFWSKLIALFLQKQDFQEIIQSAMPGDHAQISVGPAYRLICVIGNVDMQWSFWKAGISLYLGETVVMEVHSLMGHEFENSQSKKPNPNIFESRIKKLGKFCYKTKAEWKSIPSDYKDVIEIIVPEIFLVNRSLGQPLMPNQASPISSQLLVKALEIVDEVLKSHCEQFAVMGIYSNSNLLHVIPCPIEYGDVDERVQNLPFGSGLREMSGDHVNDVLGADDACAPPTSSRLLEDSLCVFTIDTCIESTLVSDVIVCPKCGPLELQALAPDLVRLTTIHPIGVVFTFSRHLYMYLHINK